MIERLSSTDLAELAADLGPDPRLVGAAVLLDGPAPTVDEVRALLAARAGRVPVLTRRIRRVPFGCGRPVWEHVAPDWAAHVTARTCPGPGDRDALADLLADVAAEPVPMDRPLWRLVVVDGLADGRGAVVWLSHHVCADGPGTLRAALAVLGESAGAAGDAPAGDAPARAFPSRGALVRDAWRARLRAVRHVRRGIRLVAAAFREIGASRGGRAPRTSVNRPIGPGIRLVSVDVDLDALRAAARAQGATVNDAVVCVIARAVGAELARRGGPVPALVVGCPVTVPAPPDAPPGNQAGVLRLVVPPPPVPDDLGAHVRQVADHSRPRKRHLSAASPVVLAPMFRGIAALGLYRPIVNRQRLINLVVTNVRGPAEPLVLCGRSVTGIVPVAPVVGNVPLSAVALSSGGRLTVTLRLSPALWPSAAALRTDLEDALDTLCHPDGRDPTGPSQVRPRTSSVRGR